MLSTPWIHPHDGAPPPPPITRDEVDRALEILVRPSESDEARAACATILGKSREVRAVPILAEILERNDGDDSLHATDEVTGFDEGPLLKLAVVSALVEIGLPDAAPAMPALARRVSQLPLRRWLVSACTWLDLRTPELEAATAALVVGAQGTDFFYRRMLHTTTLPLARALLQTLCDDYDWDDDHTWSNRGVYRSGRVAFIDQAQHDPGLKTILESLCFDTEPLIRTRAARMLDDLGPWEPTTVNQIDARAIVSSAWAPTPRGTNVTTDNDVVFRRRDGKTLFLPAFTWNDHVALGGERGVSWCVIQGNSTAHSLLFILPDRGEFERIDAEMGLSWLARCRMRPHCDYRTIIVPEFSLEIGGVIEPMAGRNLIESFPVGERPMYVVGRFDLFQLNRPFFLAVESPAGEVCHLWRVIDSVSVCKHGD
jgi:hypothetical protein